MKSGFAIAAAASVPLMGACTISPVVERIVVERIASTPGPAAGAVASASASPEASATPSPSPSPSPSPTPEPILKRRGSLIVVTGLRLAMRDCGGNSIDGYLDPSTAATKSQRVAPLLYLEILCSGNLSIEALHGKSATVPRDSDGKPRSFGDVAEADQIPLNGRSDAELRVGDVVQILLGDDASGAGGLRWMKITATKIDNYRSPAPELVLDYTYQTATGSLALE